MFKGFYTVTSGMIAQQRRTELLTNNMANANTPGFKADQSSIRAFPDMLMKAVKSTNIPTQKGLNFINDNPVGSLNVGLYMQETLANYAQGNLLQTDLNTDVALIDVQLPVDEATNSKGAVYFRLESPSGGEVYTRNGNFTLDGAGYLVNSAGYYVLSNTGERIPLPSDDFQINSDGTIYANNQLVGTLGVSFAQVPEELVKLDTGLYKTIDGTNLPSAYNVNGVSFGLQQKYLESSNVDAAQTMTELLSAYRAFEANQKVLQAYDRSMDKAVNEIGKV